MKLKYQPRSDRLSHEVDISVKEKEFREKNRAMHTVLQRIPTSKDDDQ